MEGQRVAKQPEKGKKGLVIALVVIGVLAAAYVGLCAWAGAQNTIFPNTSAAGLDVSGMTVAQAQQALEEAVAQKGSGAQVDLSYRDWSGTVTAGEVSLSAQETAQAAWKSGREHFLLQGGAYVARLAGAQGQAEPVWSSNEPAQVVELLDEAEAAVGAVTQAEWQVEGENLVMTKGRTGAAVDRQAFWSQLWEAMDGALAQRLSQEEDETVTRQLELPVTETPPQEPEFDAIHRELYAQAESAKMDQETFEVTDHVVGVDFDVEQLKAAYDSAAEGETFDFPLNIEMPKDTKESLEGKLFRDLLGEGTTPVSGSSNRKHNVKLSAEACNGVVLLPGEEFSYNNTTGSRTAEKGYKDAPTYVGGKSENNVGGGICQTSSTIYYAVLHTTLEVVERHDHQFNTGYVDEGMDATVWYGSQDFRFRNNTDYPVKIVTNSYDSNGKRYLNVKIYGTNTDGVYAVPESTTFDRVAPTTVYQPDPTVPQGTLVLDREQYAYTGISAHTYRYVYDKDGNLLEKQDMGGSKYKMRPHLYYYNPADGDPSTWVDGKPPQPGTGGSTETGGNTGTGGTETGGNTGTGGTESGGNTGTG